METLFKIFRIGPEDALRISVAPDPPHQHDYAELIIGAEVQDLIIRNSFLRLINHEHE